MSPLYPHPPVSAALCLRGQCRLPHSSPCNCKSFNVYNYIHTCNDLIYIHRVGSTTRQCVACTGSWSQHQCRGCDENEKYCAYSRTQAHISSIPGWCAIIMPCRLPDVTTIPMSFCVCSSLPQKSVQTTELSLVQL